MPGQPKLISGNVGKQMTRSPLPSRQDVAKLSQGDQVQRSFLNYAQQTPLSASGVKGT